MKLMDQLHFANGPNGRANEHVSRMREPAMRKSKRLTAKTRKQAKSYCASIRCGAAYCLFWVESRRCLEPVGAAFERMALVDLEDDVLAFALAVSGSPRTFREANNSSSGGPRFSLE